MVLNEPTILRNSVFASLTCQLQRPVSRMKEMVPCNISLLESACKSLHPYKKICSINSFVGGALEVCFEQGRAEVGVWGCHAPSIFAEATSTLTHQ